MKQVIQHIRSGDTEVAEVPAPAARAQHLVIRSLRSLISAGTERNLVGLSRAGYLEKARREPQRVQQVLAKAKTDGLIETYQAVSSKLDQPMPLGYCNVGIVTELGSGVTGFQIGDRVVSNGPHAELVVVPKNLCARVPQEVSDETAAFTVLAAIGLQGMRLAQPELGERFVVIGLGLIGLLTVQMLRANGCQVLGIDLDNDRLQKAAEFGAEVIDASSDADPVRSALGYSQGVGVDGVLITAATSSNAPIEQAAQMSRKRGRIVLVGVTGLELSRNDFYEKELSFQVSCSYGPGRYDKNYEQRGQDYPLGFVRWTEQRNFEAVLAMMRDGRLDAESLITHRIPIAEAARAYDLITNDRTAVGVVLEYPQARMAKPQRLIETGLRQPRSLRALVTGAVQTIANPWKPMSKLPVVGVIGAGNFAQRTFLPAMRSIEARRKTIVSHGGLNSVHAARTFGFERCASDVDTVIADPEIDAVAILTHPDTHVPLALRALERGKHVFMEKPLALNPEHLDQLERAYAEMTTNGAAPMLMVGFNRRFSADVQTMHELLRGVTEPKTFIMTVNAGAIPAGERHHDLQNSGGRIVEEGCHFIDLLRHLAGSSICGVQSMRIGPGVEVRDDKVTFTLAFEDGSIGTVHYFANGSKQFPKERLEVFAAGAILQLDNFRRLRGYGWPGFKSRGHLLQDKGHVAGVRAFFSALSTGGPSPTPFPEIVEVTRASFAIRDQSRGQGATAAAGQLTPGAPPVVSSRPHARA